MQQLTARAEGDEPAVIIPAVQHCVLSLKARETAALSLKRIFEQHLQRNTCSPAGASTTTLDDNDPTAETAIFRAEHATLDLDLDLRLATPASMASFCGVSTESIRHEELPQMESLELLQENTEMGDAAAPLTIFYNGSVCLFNGISAEKANAIMRLLSADSCHSCTGHGSFVDADPCRSRSRTPSSSFDITASGNPIKSRSHSHSELPFARKASLARFFEKRKTGLKPKLLKKI